MVVATGFRLPDTKMRCYLAEGEYFSPGRRTWMRGLAGASLQRLHKKK